MREFLNFCLLIVLCVTSGKIFSAQSYEYHIVPEINLNDESKEHLNESIERIVKDRQVIENIYDKLKINKNWENLLKDTTYFGFIPFFIKELGRLRNAIRLNQLNEFSPNEEIVYLFYRYGFTLDDLSYMKDVFLNNIDLEVASAGIWGCFLIQYIERTMFLIDFWNSDVEYTSSIKFGSDMLYLGKKYSEHYHQIIIDQTKIDNKKSSEKISITLVLDRYLERTGERVEVSFLINSQEEAKLFLKELEINIKLDAKRISLPEDGSSDFKALASPRILTSPRSRSSSIHRRSPRYSPRSGVIGFSPRDLDIASDEIKESKVQPPEEPKGRIRANSESKVARTLKRKTTLHLPKLSEVTQAVKGVFSPRSSSPKVSTPPAMDRQKNPDSQSLFDSGSSEIEEKREEKTSSEKDKS